jgi:hypothetical protein
VTFTERRDRGDGAEQCVQPGLRRAAGQDLPGDLQITGGRHVAEGVRGGSTCQSRRDVMQRLATHVLESLDRDEPPGPPRRRCGRRRLDLGKRTAAPYPRQSPRVAARLLTQDLLPLTPRVLAAHLSGEIHFGLYPLLDGDRCWWLIVILNAIFVERVMETLSCSESTGCAMDDLTPVT